MAITKEIVIAKIEVVNTWSIQVATDTVVKEDDTEIGRSRHRHVLQPSGFYPKYRVFKSPMRS